MDAIVKTLLPSIILLSLVLVPLGLIVVSLLWAKHAEKRDARRSPLNEKLLHQAGSQARKRADELGDDLVEHVGRAMMIGPLAMLVILLPRVSWERLQFNWLDWLVMLGAAACIAWLIRAIFRVRKERRKWQQGMLAEIAAAQQLDRLQAQDCLVLHDLPAADFNIDHVVVGPHAVFAVETKSRLKPGQGKASANVTYDGNALQFPGWKETRPVEQARAQAGWLAKYLREETGESVVVFPVLCLPGWFVTSGKNSQRSDVRVINPKMSSVFVDAGNQPRLPVAQRNRIVHALQKRYPDIN